MLSAMHFVYAVCSHCAVLMDVQILNPAVSCASHLRKPALRPCYSFHSLSDRRRCPVRTTEQLPR